MSFLSCSNNSPLFSHTYIFSKTETQSDLQVLAFLVIPTYPKNKMISNFSTSNKTLKTFGLQKIDVQYFFLFRRFSKFIVGSLIVIRYVCVYDEHPLAGREIQYWAPHNWSRYTTPFDEIKVMCNMLCNMLTILDPNDPCN